MVASGQPAPDRQLRKEGKMVNIYKEMEFVNWEHRFKIDKISLTKKERNWIKRGFFELYEMLRVKSLPYKIGKIWKV